MSTVTQFPFYSKLHTFPSRKIRLTPSKKSPMKKHKWTGSVKENKYIYCQNRSKVWRNVVHNKIKNASRLRSLRSKNCNI